MLSSKIKADIFIVATVLLFNVFCISDSCAGTDEKIRVNDLVSRLNSEDLNQRSKAVFEITTLREKGIIVNEALPGLIKELERVDFEHLSEATGEYSGDLIYILGEYRDDRAIPVLLKGLSHVGGTAVTESYAKIGPALLEALFQESQKESPAARIAAISYIGKLPSHMIKYGHSVSKNQKSKIKSILISNLKSGNFTLRTAALSAIDEVHGLYDKEALKDFITLLEHLSRTDPHRDGEQTSIFPIRNSALTVLDHLKAG